MKIVRLLKDALGHGAFKGEVLGLPDDAAAKLVARGAAAYQPEPKAESVEATPVVEAEPEAESVEPDADVEEEEDADEPVKRGPGRPRKLR